MPIQARGNRDPKLKNRSRPSPGQSETLDERTLRGDGQIRTQITRFSPGPRRCISYSSKTLRKTVVAPVNISKAITASE